jgi:phosphate-selective porin OprO/OprP
MLRSSFCKWHMGQIFGDSLMKSKRHSKSKITRLVASGVAVLSLAASCNVFARAESDDTGRDTITRETPQEVTQGGWDLGGGWKIGTFGGVSYVNPNNVCHWFKMTGSLRADQTFFMGSYRDKGNLYPNGGSIRSAQLSAEGGVGRDWEYSIGLDFTSSLDSSVRGSSSSHVGVELTDTFLAYSGFMENNQIFVGQLTASWFGLENSTSTSWNPFLEKSLQAQAFFPGEGLGVMTDFWWDNGDITFLAVQPGIGARSKGKLLDGAKEDIEDNNTHRDQWLALTRLTYCPVVELGNVWHFGVSAAWWEAPTSYKNRPYADKGNDFSARPSARARNTPSLINTGPIRANYTRQVNLEMARQFGSFLISGEYSNAYMHRVGSPRGSLQFNGWSTQMSYILTGEVHEYDVRDGNFGTIKPCGEYGAFEIAARYDFLNLNDKDLRGGTQHDVTLGLNWYVNNNVRLSANYVRASIHPSELLKNVPVPYKRNLDIIGVRAQLRFK